MDRVDRGPRVRHRVQEVAHLLQEEVPHFAHLLQQEEVPHLAHLPVLLQEVAHLLQQEEVRPFAHLLPAKAGHPPPPASQDEDGPPAAAQEEKVYLCLYRLQAE